MKVNALMALAILALLWPAAALRAAVTKTTWSDAPAREFVFVENNSDDNFFVTPGGALDPRMTGANRWTGLKYTGSGTIYQQSLGYIDNGYNTGLNANWKFDMWLENSPVSHPLTGLRCINWYAGCDMATSLILPQTTDASGFYGATVTSGGAKWMHGMMSDAFYQYLQQMPVGGSFTMTTISIKSAFESRGDAGNGYSSKTFARFQQYLNTFQSRVEARYANATYPAATGLQGKFDPANGTVDKYSSDVMIPAFLAAYTGGGDINSPLDIFPSLARMLPNWTVSYKGLAYLPWIRDHFKSVTLNHSYKSIYSVGAYNTYSSWMEYMGDLGFIQNTTDNAIIPSSMYDISSVSINEAFSPLAGLDLTLNNNMTVKVEYRKTRVLTLSMTAAQLNEACSNDFVIGWGYKINDFKFSSLFGGRRKKAGRSNNNKQTNAANNRNNTRKSGTSAKNSRVISHDLNLRFDFSFRNQDAITRNIQTSLSEATSGNKAIKASFSADYTMSRYVTLSLYYDRQRNQPLLSSNAYPTITQDFGFSLRFSLTR